MNLGLKIDEIDNQHIKIKSHIFIV